MSEDVSPKHPIKPKESREQASENLGFFSSVIYDLGDGETWELPNPQFMDPDMRRRYLEHLRFISEDLDTSDAKDPITGEVRKVQKFPLRKGGTLIIEEELLCIALMGEDIYAKFLAAGGVPGQVGTTWQMMQHQLQERARRDSKSS